MLLHQAPSVETLLTKKLNETTNKISVKAVRKSGGSIQNSSMSRGDDSTATLKSHQNLNNITGESKKHWMNVTADLSKHMENISFLDKKDKVKNTLNGTIKRATSNIKTRPPLTDRSNLLGF